MGPNWQADTLVVLVSIMLSNPRHVRRCSQSNGSEKSSKQHRIVWAGPIVTATTRVPRVLGGRPVLRCVGLFRSYGHPRVVHSARAAKSAGSVESDVLISGACRHVLARVRTYLGWLAFTPHCVGQCSPPHPRLFAADTSDCIFTMRSNIFEEFPN